MSLWTHIVATLHVDTSIESKGIEALVRERLEDAPRITGSEGDADVFVNVISGHNIWVGCDCQRCEYGHTVKGLDTGGFTCESPAGYDCPSGTYQSMVVITVVGDLRDRMRDDTKAEWFAFKKFVEKEIGYIRNFTWKIQGW